MIPVSYVSSFGNTGCELRKRAQFHFQVSVEKWEDTRHGGIRENKSQREVMDDQEDRNPQGTCRNLGESVGWTMDEGFVI